MIQPAIPEPTIETKLQSKHYNLLNSLNEMQQAMLYAARWPVLREAENLIVTLESRIRDLEAEVERLLKINQEIKETVGCNACLETIQRLREALEYAFTRLIQGDHIPSIVLRDIREKIQQALAAKGGGWGWRRN